MARCRYGAEDSAVVLSTMPAMADARIYDRFGLCRNDSSTTLKPRWRS